MRPKRVDAFHRATNGGFAIAFKADGTNAAQTARIDGVRPVSYTHLDVYKRQV